MENQHRKITGYRELDAVEIALMNDIKAHAAAGHALCQRVNAHVDAQHRATQPTFGTDGETTTDNVLQVNLKEAEAARLKAAEPFRWVAIAKTDFQTAAMALTRAVAQPENF